MRDIIKKREYDREYYKKNRESCIKYTIDYYKKHPERKLKIAKTYRDKNKEKTQTGIKLWRINNPEKAKLSPWISNLKRRYNITPEQYFDLLKIQDNACAICRRQSKRKLAVDHDHISGEIRGLLCTSCNTGIGLLQDCPHVLNNALKYLSKYSPGKKSICAY